MPIDTTRGRAMAEAITAPSALLLAGAGASVAILAGVPIVAAGLVGAAAWGVRVWQRLPKVAGKDRIDVFALREPWRHYVRDALHARDKFDKAVTSTDAGPLRERLAGIAARVDDAVHECHSIARRGQELSLAVKELNVGRIRRELADVEAQSRRHPERDDLSAACASLQSQLASAQRLASVARDAGDKLTRINAELDEAVARAVELSLAPSLDVAEIGVGVSPLGTDVENIVGELETLRLALDEAGRA